MNEVSFVQSSSLQRELLLQSQNSNVLLKCLWFGCTSMCKGLWDRIGIFSKLKITCDIDTVLSAVPQPLCLNQKAASSNPCHIRLMGGGHSVLQFLHGIKHKFCCCRCEPVKKKKTQGRQKEKCPGKILQKIHQRQGLRLLQHTFCRKGSFFFFFFHQVKGNGTLKKKGKESVFAVGVLVSVQTYIQILVECVGVWDGEFGGMGWRREEERTGV